MGLSIFRGVIPVLDSISRSGYSSGCGSGYRSGYGSGYWQAVFATAVQSLQHNQQARLAILQDATIGFWRSDADAAPINGGNRKSIASAGLVQTVEGPLEICT